MKINNLTVEEQKHYARVLILEGNHGLHLNEEDTARFFEMQKAGVDVEWLMLNMKTNSDNLLDALVNYVIDK